MEQQDKVESPPRLTTVRWAELLIEQLPVDGEGRNSWLLIHGVGLAAIRLRDQWRKKHGRPWTQEEK